MHVVAKGWVQKLKQGTGLGCHIWWCVRLVSSHATTWLEHETEADRYCCVHVTEVTGLTKCTLINAKKPHVLHAYIYHKIMCFSLKVKNKPQDGCTQVCVHSRTVCMDVNKSSSEFGSS
jgi:hypothetical protein